MESNFSNDDAIAVLAANDPQRFCAFVEHYQHALFGFLGRMGFVQADAEDVAQEVFLKAWRFRDSYDPARALVSTWLFTIARNTALSKLASQNYSTIALTEIELTAERRQQPDQQLQRQHTQQLLIRAIHQLDFDDRTAVALFYIDALSVEQAATIMQCTAGAFKTRLSRARNKLKVICQRLEDTNEY